jgi:hypothetical protein
VAGWRNQVDARDLKSLGGYSVRVQFPPRLPTMKGLKMYESTYALETIGTFNTFEEAFAAIYHRLKTDLEGSGMSYQLLETSIWIKNTNMSWIPGNPLNPIFFYDARDKACNIGLLKDGVLQEDVLQRAVESAKKTIHKQPEETN